MQNDTYPMEKKPLNNPDIKLSVPSVAGKPPFLYHSTEVKKKRSQETVFKLSIYYYLLSLFHNFYVFKI